MRSILADYLDQILPISDSGEDDHQFLYRGQSDASWHLASSAVRRPGVSVTNGSLIEYNRELIRGFKERRFEAENRQPMTDLEILAHLQHLGAATSLIDFSHDPLIALWFACQEHRHDTPGKVFKLDITFSLGRDPGSEFGDCLKRLISPLNLLAWSPPHTVVAQERVLAQRSAMVLGPDLAESVPQHAIVRQVEIRQRHKKELQEALVSVGIDESSLFPDIYGYAYMHRASKLRQELSAPEILRQATRAFNQNEFLEASELYVLYLQQHSGNVELEVRLSLANAYVGQRMYEKALAVLEPVESGVDQLATHVSFSFRFNVANILAALDRHVEALQLYDDLLANNSSHRIPILFNRGNSLFALRRYDDAINSYDKCTDNAPAFYNCANAHLLLGQLASADDKLVEAMSLQSAPSHYRRNLATVRDIRALLGQSNIEVSLSPGQDNSQLPLVTFIVNQAQLSDRPRIFPLDGNAGNHGNVGVPALHVGRVHGSPGFEGFGGTSILVRSAS